MRRFFVNPADITEKKAVMYGPEAHHLRSVLRLQPEDTICLFDGTGMLYHAVVTNITKHHVESTIISREQSKELIPRLHIGQGLLTGKKMDFVVQKATELGIRSIHPFLSKHCTVKPHKDAKDSRWNRIAHEACKQCGRALPPDCLSITDFDALIKEQGLYDVKIIFWEQEHIRTLHDLVKTKNVSPELRDVLCLIGPEGGFSQEEITLAEKNGFIPVTLGNRILRAETASLSAMAILQFLLGRLDHGE